MANASADWVTAALSLFEPAPKSLADTLLAKVFGNWVIGDVSGQTSVYQGFVGMDEVTLISTILGFSGILAAAFGLLIGSYGWLMQIVTTAWSGNFTPRGGEGGVNSMLYPARSVMAFALIIPIVTIGSADSERTTSIASAQVGLMGIVRAGSGFADNVSAAYVKNSLSYPISTSRPPDTELGVVNMMKIAVCAVAAARKEAAGGGEDSANFAQIASTKDAEGKVTTYYDSRFASSDSFSGLSDDKTLVGIDGYSGLGQRLLGGSTSLDSITFGNNGLCGRIELGQQASQAGQASNSSVSNTTAGILSRVQANVGQSYRPAYAKLISETFTWIDSLIASGRYESLINDVPRSDAGQIPEAKTFYARIVSFNKEVYNDVADALNVSQEELGGTLYEPVIEQGWAALGAIHNVIPRVANIALYNIEQAHSQISATTSDFPCVDGGFFDVGEGDDCDTRDIISNLTSVLEASVRRYASNYAAASQPRISVLDYCTIDQCDIRTVSSSLTQDIARGILNTAMEMGDIGNTYRVGETTGGLNADAGSSRDGELGDVGARSSQDPNPSVSLAALGSTMTYMGGLMTLSELYLRTANQAAKGASDSAAGLVGLGVALAPLKAALQIAIGMVKSLGSKLLTTGFILSYVLPLMPFSIFTMQVIGWLATVIEGMFAVCFAVALLTNTDGDGAINTGFLKALSLISATFLKPVFIVFGVVASQAIAGPAFAYFNDQYWIAWDMEYALGGSGGGMAFNLSAQLILYVALAGFLQKFIYSIQHLLPDQLNTWISGAIANPFGVQGVAENLMSSVGSTAEHATTAGQASVRAVAKGRR